MLRERKPSKMRERRQVELGYESQSPLNIDTGRDSSRRGRRQSVEVVYQEPQGLQAIESIRRGSAEEVAVFSSMSTRQVEFSPGIKIDKPKQHIVELENNHNAEK